MKKDNTTMVNGQLYNTVTGMPVAQTDTKNQTPTTRTKTQTPAGKLHSTTQPSATLRRGATQKKPVASQPPAQTVQPKRQSSRAVSMDIARSPQVRKFTKPAAKPAETTPAGAADIAPRSHPHQLRANQRIAQKKQATKQPTPVVSKPSKQVKEEEITKALATKPEPAKKPKQKTKQASTKQKRLARIGFIAAAVLVAILITLWVNLPSLWVNFAAMQSNVDANYPEFTPDGYSLQLPIKAKENQVRIVFGSNQNNSSFTISQENSKWDSQAVRAMVEERSDGKFLTTNDRGLTIYTFDGDAAWVNGGILYQLTGDAKLSNDTITRIANSL